MQFVRVAGCKKHWGCCGQAVNAFERMCLSRINICEWLVMLHWAFLGCCHFSLVLWHFHRPCLPWLLVAKAAVIYNNPKFESLLPVLCCLPVPRGGRIIWFCVPFIFRKHVVWGFFPSWVAVCRYGVHSMLDSSFCDWGGGFLGKQLRGGNLVKKVKPC